MAGRFSTRSDVMAAGAPFLKGQLRTSPHALLGIVIELDGFVYDAGVLIPQGLHNIMAVVLCVSRAVLSVVLGAWSVRFVGWADWVDCRCFLVFCIPRRCQALGAFSV